jgi:ADP-ribose pyrophosphatase YjhB (NUDIX family)
MIVGCIPRWQGKILLCRRAIEPRYGLWTLPAGFMENQETADEGAAREALEEANCRVQIIQPFALASLPAFDQVHLFYIADLLEDSFSAGSETLETRLFQPENIPWESLAFDSVTWCLKRYLDECNTGKPGFHSTTLTL